MRFLAGTPCYQGLRSGENPTRVWDPVGCAGQSPAVQGQRESRPGKVVRGLGAGEERVRRGRANEPE